MRERGLRVDVASINPPDRSRKDLPPIEAAEAATTYYIKSGGMVSVALQVIAVAAANPFVALRGLRAALALGELDLKARAFAFFYLAEALLVGRWMQRNALTHLHVHFGGPVATVGMLTARSWRLPWSITLHGPDEFFDQEAFYLRRKIESASFVICISDFCRSQVLRIVPELPESRTEVVRLGVDCKALQPVKSEQTPTSSVHLVCTGRMVAAKGHRILIQALAPLLNAGIAITCTLIGDGPERPFLEGECRRLGISPQVRFLGALAHQATIEEVSRADVFVLASFAEGLPVALMEAMALGVPCISTTIAAIPELIQNQENGLLVPPANVPALRSALERMVLDSESRRLMGIKARATADAQYNLATNLDTLAETWSRRLLREDTSI